MTTFSLLYSINIDFHICVINLTLSDYYQPSSRSGRRELLHRLSDANLATSTQPRGRSFLSHLRFLRRNSEVSNNPNQHCNKA